MLLHGFTQTGESWRPLLARLRRDHFVIVPDLPGHGAASGVACGMWETAAMLAATVSLEVAGGAPVAPRAPGPRRAPAYLVSSEVAGGAPVAPPSADATSVIPATWTGYSMGGRAALHVALAYPGVVSRLVLVSSSAGIEDEQERAARRLRDEAIAARVEDGGDERLGEFLSEWLSQPLFATLPKGLAGLPRRVAANTAAGLASSLRLAGAGAQEPLWRRLPELSGRAVLLIVGELDAKYRENAERMAEAIGPGASISVIGGAGHACHLERPGLVAEEIALFCAGSSGQRQPQGQQQAEG